jgi:hypothetical protein
MKTLETIINPAQGDQITFLVTADVAGLFFPLFRIVAGSPAGKRTEARLLSLYCRQRPE